MGTATRVASAALLLVGLVLVAGSLVSTPDVVAEEDEAGRVVWHDDLDAARAKAAAEDRPLLVVFQ